VIMLGRFLTIGGAVLLAACSGLPLNAVPPRVSIADVEVALVDSNTDLVLETTVTSAAGVFRFEDLIPGDYTVRQVVPEGYTLAYVAGGGTGIGLAGAGSGAVAEQFLTLDEGGVGSAAFPTLVIGSITGTVFEDGNGDGQFSTGEQGLAGVLVELRLAGNPEVALSTFTTAGGTFVFPNLGAADYEVSQQTLSGYYSPQTTRSITITGSSAATVSFANYREGSIGGKVFHDENADGRQDPGEPGLSLVTLSLSNASGTIRVFRTSGDGSYVFSGLTPGVYTVRESDPALFTSTTPNQRSITLAAGAAGSVSFGDVALPPVEPVLELTQATPGAWNIRLLGEAGRTYVVEWSRDLRHWNRLMSRKSTTGEINHTDLAADQGPRFYRARVE